MVSLIILLLTKRKWAS